MVALGAAPLADIEKDPALLALARARGKTVFGDNCAPCHGSGGAGAKGYPNLNDDDWLWGGTLDQIMQTIQFGARSGHAKTHESAMLAFGKDGVLKKDQIVTVANYVRVLSGLSTSQGYDASAGAKIFAENCVSCHGDAGKGNQELGAPDLTDKIWLLRFGRGDTGRDHHQRPCRRDAGLGRPARSCHDQGADRLSSTRSVVASDRCGRGSSMRRCLRWINSAAEARLYGRAANAR